MLEGGRPLTAGARYDLHDVDEVIVGRGPERHAERRLVGGARQLLVRVPDRWLSSLHARILRNGVEGFTLEDAGSTNGSVVGGLRVKKAPLLDGDRIELGRCFFVFRSSLPTPSSAETDMDLSAAPRPALVTSIPSLAAEYRMLERVAPSLVPVVITGETGTGKEVLARALHAASGRSGPFVAVNCGAIVDSLKEAQLFGHARGAFTGAHRDEPGLVRAADRGTLLLDEVAELSPAAQVALLRVLQERQVTPVGASSSTAVDVRFACASHEPIQAACARGAFRRDLLARLDGFTFTTRPLRERMEDLGILVASLLERHAPHRGIQIAPDAGRALLSYGWPLNVRELDQCLGRACALAEKGTIQRQHLPPALLDAGMGSGAAAPSRAHGTTERPRPLTDTDARIRARVVELLEKHEGNITETARVMGKARSQVQRWVRRFKIDPRRLRRRS